MPMTVLGMKNAMLVELNLNDVTGLDTETKSAIEDRIECLAKAIVEYIKSSALVSTIVTTTGSAAAQTGTGTGTIS